MATLPYAMRISCQIRAVKVKEGFRLSVTARRASIFSLLPVLEVQHKLLGREVILGGRSASRSVDCRTAFFLTCRPVSQCTRS